MNDQNPTQPMSPWVAFGESPAYEDSLIGNRAGLTHLRDAITESLSNGEAVLPFGSAPVCRVLVIDSEINPQTLPKKRGWKDALSLFGCALVIFPIGLLCILGLMSLFKK